MLECPRCESNDIEKLPPSQISPHPGYLCNGCGSKLRSSGMLVIYLGVLLVGLAMAVGGVWLFVETEGGDRPFKILWLCGIGVVVAGYSAMQIARPVPRKVLNFNNADQEN